MKAPSKSPLTKAKLKAVQKSVEEGLCPSMRWQTVRDAIGDLPDPTKPYDITLYRNHEHRPGAKTYAGHSGSLLDEPSKTIKAGAHGVPVKLAAAVGQSVYDQMERMTNIFVQSMSARLSRKAPGKAGKGRMLIPELPYTRGSMITPNPSKLART